MLMFDLKLCLCGFFCHFGSMSCPVVCAGIWVGVVDLDPRFMQPLDDSVLVQDRIDQEEVHPWEELIFVG